MIATFLNRVATTDDKFAFVLGDPLLYGIAADSEKVAEFRAAVDAIGWSQEDRWAIELGTVYVLRRYSLLDEAKALSWIEEVLAHCELEPRLRARARLTWLATMTSRGDLEAARSGFEKCVSETRSGEDHLAYALGCMGLGEVAMILGEPRVAEASYESALETCRRYDYDLLAAFAINNLGILKKNIGEYGASIRLLSQARNVYLSLGLRALILSTTRNLGITCFRTGDWKAARRWFGARSMASVACPSHVSDDRYQDLGWILSESHMLLAQRNFVGAEGNMTRIASDCVRYPRLMALNHEFLGELYAELGDYSTADEHLRVAFETALDVAPLGDVMTEILRRQAQLFLCQGSLDDAKATALRCIGLSRKIGDRYEFAAALRVLGETYVAQGRAPRAAACFRAAVHTLKSIHECYELMRALYAQGKFLASDGKPDEAEIALLEARQLSKKLELEYYQALIAVAMMDTLGPQERFEEAQSWLAEASELREHLEGVDRDRVDTAVKRAANDLQRLITRASVKSAETLKTICRVYEDARFPFEDMRADLAYQIAQSINAESLFVIGKVGTGFRVPITYNISTNESKEIVRRLERILGSKTLLNVGDEPQILKTMEGRTLLAVPCREDDALARARKNGDGFVACARFEDDARPGPRQIELFCASAEALARIIDEEDVRPARKAAEPDAADDEAASEPSRNRHPRGSFANILTIDPELIKLIRTAERAAGSVAPILLEGETGVGKELFARAIHGASQRKDGPFVAINAGGMSVHLLESELFGHVKGAFTDAGNDRTGLVDTARGGSLFFDEVGEMGEEMQVKLLRLMENGEYRRLGESATRKADVRVISATNRDLKKDAERGLFRRDLYYRLSPLKLTVPPLRLRACDIQLMTRYFLRECAAMNGIADRYIEIDVKAMEALELYDWPGNVRELHNEILRVVSLIGRGDFVRFAMLSEHIKDFLKTKKRGDGLLDRSVEQYERRLILDALEKNDWNKLRTADAIGIPRTTLLAKLKRMNIASKS